MTTIVWRTTRIVPAVCPVLPGVAPGSAALDHHLLKAVHRETEILGSFIADHV